MVALGNVQKMGRTDGSRVDTVDTATQHFINIQCEHSHNITGERREREREGRDGRASKILFVIAFRLAGGQIEVRN